MRKWRSERFAALLYLLKVSMDHRVIGERSDAVLRTAMPGGDERGENAALDCLADARNDERKAPSPQPSPRPRGEGKKERDDSFVIARSVSDEAISNLKPPDCFAGARNDEWKDSRRTRSGKRLVISSPSPGGGGSRPLGAGWGENTAAKRNERQEVHPLPTASRSTSPLQGEVK